MDYERKKKRPRGQAKRFEFIECIRSVCPPYTCPDETLRGVFCLSLDDKTSHDPYEREKRSTPARASFSTACIFLINILYTLDRVHARVRAHDAMREEICFPVLRDIVNCKMTIRGSPSL